MNDNMITVFHTYNDALTKGDLTKVFEVLSDDIKWYQPGKNPLSGEIFGKEKLAEHLSKFAEKSNGTFNIADCKIKLDN